MNRIFLFFAALTLGIGTLLLGEDWFIKNIKEIEKGLPDISHDGE